MQANPNTTVALARAELAARIDHTFLDPAGDSEAIRNLCREASFWSFACAMVNPCCVKEAVRCLRKSEVRVGTVVGFPLGQATAKMKRLEAEEAIRLGAREIDFVVNQRLLKAAVYDAAARRDLEDELEACAGVKAMTDGVTTKLILECCRLTDEEKLLGCAFAVASGFDFVKTSTGFARGGATPADVALMRRAVGDACRVKAAGGIRTLAEARAMLAAGADRLGCSASVAILRELGE